MAHEAALCQLTCFCFVFADALPLFSVGADDLLLRFDIENTFRRVDEA